jgi:hypothetical protein
MSSLPGKKCHETRRFSGYSGSQDRDKFEQESKIHLIQEVRINTQRLVTVAFTLSLMVVAALTLRTAFATSAFTYTPRNGYDEVERARANFNAGKSADLSYDQVKWIRSQYFFMDSTDQSYDEVERSRSNFLSTRSVDSSHTAVDLSDYALRHPGLFRLAAPDTSDWYLRHRDEFSR